MGRERIVTIEAPDTTAVVDFLDEAVEVRIYIKDGKLCVEASMSHGEGASREFVRQRQNANGLLPVRRGARPMKPFPPGALVYVDGRDRASVTACFPKGSTSFLFPHYKVNFVDGDRNVTVAFDRVGVEPR